MLFHKVCFKCTTCGGKLDGNFGKNELGFFCITHFHEIAKLTGGYKTGTGPTNNAATASLVEALVHRSDAGKHDAADGGVMPPAAVLPEVAVPEAVLVP